jgi:hypothetical protein
VAVDEILYYDGAEGGWFEADAAYNVEASSTVAHTGDFSLKGFTLLAKNVYVRYGKFNPSTGRYDAPFAKNNVVATGWFYFNSTFDFTEATKTSLVSIYDSSGDGICAGLNSDGKLIVFDKSSGTILYTHGTAFSKRQWYRIDVYLGTAASTPYEVWLDDASVASGTYAISNATKSLVAYGQITGYNQKKFRLYMDDLSGYEATEPMSNPLVLPGLFNAAGDHDQWLDGTWSDLNDLPWTVDCYSSSLNREEMHKCDNTAALTGVPVGKVIRCLKVTAFLGADVDDTVKCEVRLKHNEDEEVQATDFLTTGYLAYMCHHETCPDTGELWTWDDIDTVHQAGVKLTTTFGDVAYVSHMQYSFLYDDADPAVDKRRRFIAHAGI